MPPNLRNKAFPPCGRAGGGYEVRSLSSNKTAALRKRAAALSPITEDFC